MKTIPFKIVFIKRSNETDAEAWNNKFNKGFLEECVVDGEIEPVFNRNGQYLDGDKCWIEWHGRAFKRDADNFKADLALLEAAELSDREIQALLTLEKEFPSIVTKEQRKLIQNIRLNQEIKEIVRPMKLVRKRLKQKRAARHEKTFTRAKAS